MSREAGESQKTFWTLSIVVSVLYVLSVPWVVAYGDKRVSERVLVTYRTPYGLLARIPDVAKPLQDYLLRCGHKAHRGPFFHP